MRSSQLIDPTPVIERSSKRIRLTDIAERARVSPQVVSVVLRNGGSSTMRIAERTAAKVRRIADEMGYWPNLVAQQWRGNQSDLIGALIGASSTAANFRRLAAIEQEAYRQGHRLMIGQFHEDASSSRDYLADLLARGIDRLICFQNPAPASDSAAVRLLSRFRSVVFQSESPLPDGFVVDVDRAAGMTDAVAHLVRQGRRRIALILSAPASADILMQHRLDGFRLGMAQASLDSHQLLEWAGDGVFPPSAERIVAAVDFLNVNQADAVIASNDVWAIELMRAFRRIGRSVPESIAIVGFDNIDAASLSDPALTTVDPNYEAFAKYAVELVLQDGPVADRRRVVRPLLVIRESA